MKVRKKDSFVAISDFHSCDWPIHKIEDYYLNEYETIYILGDCTDRGESMDGTGGIDLLFKIKQLSEEYPGRVIYIPGNHDSFVLNYAKTQDWRASMNMARNHGMQTVSDIDELRQNNPQKLNELINWLGNLPLQREHFMDGKRFVFAHALFNEKLFRENKNFSLNDYFNSNGINGKYGPILWFRKQNDSYDKDSLPRGDSVMVIGHTPEQCRIGLDLDLVNSHNETVKVYCVDGGITFGNAMLKFDGGFKLHHSIIGEHNCTARFDSSTNGDVSTSTQTNEYSRFEAERIFNNQIIELIRTSDTLESALSRFLCIASGLSNDNNSDIYKILMKEDIHNYLNDQLLYYVTKGKEENNTNMIISIKNMIIEIALDYIIACLIKKFDSRKKAIHNLNGYFWSHNSYYITNSVGNARDITEKIKIEDLQNVIENSGFSSTSDYVNNRVGKQFIIK